MLKIILDTDMGPDCDDAGALAIANKLHRKGEIQLLGVTHCTSDIGGAYTIAAINRMFSNQEIPVGQTSETGFLDEKENQTFTAEIKADYIRRYGTRSFEDSTFMLRKLLAENTGVKLICIGQLNNLAALLKSEEDAISPKNGRELVAASLKAAVIMGGDFRGSCYDAEYNIRCDVESARYVAANCPVPITYCGYEVGMEVLSGKAVQEWRKTNPVRIAYDRFLKKNGQNNSFLRPSWDLIAVSFGVKGGMGLWNTRDHVTVDFDMQGKTIVKQGGKDSYLVNVGSADKIAVELEALLKL